MKRSILFAVLFVLVAVLPLQAQSDEAPSRWGVKADFPVSWDLHPSFKPLYGSGTVKLMGSDFSIGFIRGKEMSGDWGVSLVRRKVTDFLIDESYFFTSGNTEYKGGTVYDGAMTATGVEIHRYSPLVTIKRRVQIGLNFAGGIASAKGDVRKETYYQESICPTGWIISGSFRSCGSVPVFVQGQQTELLSAKEVLKEKSKLSFMPLGRVELVVAVMPVSRLKVKFSGGLNFPGVQKFGVGIQYLF